MEPPPPPSQPPPGPTLGIDWLRIEQQVWQAHTQRNADGDTLTRLNYMTRFPAISSRPRLESIPVQQRQIKVAVNRPELLDAAGINSLIVLPFDQEVEIYWELSGYTAPGRFACAAAYVMANQGGQTKLFFRKPACGHESSRGSAKIRLLSGVYLIAVGAGPSAKALLVVRYQTYMIPG